LKIVNLKQQCNLKTTLLLLQSRLLMKTKLLLLSIAVCFLYISSNAQDLHYSNYTYSPLYLNPANTGGFNGSIRVGASHRDQFRTFIGEAYQSTMVYVDSPVSFLANEKMWLGLGANLFSDRVGDLGFGLGGVTGSAAFHYSLDDNYTTVFALGAQYGIVQRKISKAGAAIWGDQLLDPSLTSQDQSLIDDFNTTFSDVNVGLNMKHWFSDDNQLEVGVSAHHLTSPTFKLQNSNTNNRVNIRYNAYASIQIMASSKFYLIPAAYFSQYDNVSNIQAQLNSKILLEKKKKNKKEAAKLRDQSYLTLGVGYRFGDALQFFAGGIHKSWEFGLSYDLTTSTANEYNNAVGGLEIGVKKYIDLRKKPEIKVINICPRV